MTFFSAKAEVHVCVCKWFFSLFPFVENQPRTTCSEMTAFTLQRKADDECASRVFFSPHSPPAAAVPRCVLLRRTRARTRL